MVTWEEIQQEIVRARGFNRASETQLLKVEALIAEMGTEPAPEPEEPVKEPTPEPTDPVSGGGSHEPEGFVPVADNDFQVAAPEGWTDWGTLQDNWLPVEIVEDPDAPISPPYVGRALFRQGYTGGGGPVNLISPQIGSNAVFLRFGLGVSENWFGHNSGVGKIFFLKQNDKPERSQVIFTAWGGGDSSLNLVITPQGTKSEETGTTYNLRANPPSYDQTYPNGIDVPEGADEIVRGQYHDIAALIIGGTPGVADGEVHAWVDGVKTHQYTGIQVLPDESDALFDFLAWNPTYGGGSGADPIPEDQYQYIDHIYVSTPAA